MEITINKRLIAHILFITLLCYADLFSLLPDPVGMVLLVIPVILLLFDNGFRIRDDAVMLLVIIAVMILVLFRNHELVEGRYGQTIKWMIRLVYIVVDCTTDRIDKEYLTLIPGIGFLNVLATWFFLLVPSAYSVMYRLWGDYPGGVYSFNEGYRAGITDHYSHNGTIIAFIVLALFAMILCEREQNRGSWLDMRHVCFVLSFLALILTAKRAHLVFCLLTMVIIYSLCNPDKIGERAVKLFIASGVVVILAALLAFTNSELVQFFSRFETLGVDGASQSRIKFWAVAIGLWKDNPLFGIGWFGFRNQFSTFFPNNSNDYLNAHNVFVQLLCETGIVGLVFGMIVLGWVLYSTLCMLRKTYSEEECRKFRLLLLSSSIFQVFFLLYCLTGNGLYDVTFGYYCMAVSVSLTMRYRPEFAGISRCIESLPGNGTKESI